MTANRKSVSKKKKGNILTLLYGSDVPVAFGSLSWVADKMEGKAATFAELVRVAARRGNEQCEQFMIGWDEMTAEERQLPSALDHCAKATEIDCEEIFAQVTKVMHRYSMNASRLLASMQQPEIVSATIACAKKEEADFHRDRKLMLESTGFAPTRQVSRGAQVQVNTQVNAGGTSAIEGMPEFEQSINATSKLIRGETE